MTEIVLFHHAQGLTPGLVAFADVLRAAGHTVHTPDLFEGRTFPTLDEGIAYARTVGFGTILDRGVTEADGARVGRGLRRLLDGRYAGPEARADPGRRAGGAADRRLHPGG